MGTQLPRYPADGQATDLGLLYWLPQSLSALAWRLVGLENARATGGGRSRHMRVQATDWQRRSAWSNPIFAS